MSTRAPERPHPAMELIPASTPTQGLPRSGRLTDALLDDPIGAGSLEDVTDLRAYVERGLLRAAGGRLGAGDPPATARLLRIGHHQIAHMRAAHDVGRPHAPEQGARPAFRWTSRTARRTIGLAALRLGLDGCAASPADAVAMVLSEPDGPLGVGRAGPGSCADWLTSLAPAARSFVAAEAAAWATRLWTALDWGRLEAPQLVVGGPDRWWRWPGTVAAPGDLPAHPAHPAGRALRIALRGRADVRVGPPRCDGALVGAHLLVLDGQPRVATRHALLLSALVDALVTARSTAPVPRRVVGWWPECGKAWIVEVDDRTLRRAADAVALAVAVALSGPAPEEAAATD